MIDKTPENQQSLVKASQFGGEYLDSIGVYDLTRLTEEQWATFIECVVDGFLQPPF